MISRQLDSNINLLCTWTSQLFSQRRCRNHTHHFTRAEAYTTSSVRLSSFLRQHPFFRISTFQRERTVMPLFKKKPPPQWFVMRPKKYSSSDAQPTREGPYTRATITQLYGEGMLGDGALIWTNEKIFPNAQKPNSIRPVRIMEWRRLDQLPDPVVRQLAGDWQQLKAGESNPAQGNPQAAQPNNAAGNDEAIDSTDSIPPTAPPPPPPPYGATPVAQPQHGHPAPTSMYPAGVQQPTPQHQAPMNHPQTSVYPQSGAYPAPSPHPPPAPGAY